MAEGRMNPRCVLFENDDKTVILIDGPTSIEEAQVLSSNLEAEGVSLRRIISSKPPDAPFKTPEPKGDALNILAPSAQLTELMTTAAVTNALETLQYSYSGPWCLPRLLSQPQGDNAGGESRKRKASSEPGDALKPLKLGSEPKSEEPLGQAPAFIPEGSVYLLGTIASERERFIAEAPVFDLIVLDPPWPNRSARRKKDSYSTAENLHEIRKTLSLIPIGAHLAPDGLVAVWITNKASIVELLTSPRGLFGEWGVELVDEWTWLKVTSSGEPIFDVESKWRKPWERLLIARRRGSELKWHINGKVIVSIPDLHSRKPSLRTLFEQVLPPGYKALEVFARNLTAGWWSWGDEVLKFQSPEHWLDPYPFIYT